MVRSEFQGEGQGLCAQLSHFSLQSSPTVIQRGKSCRIFLNFLIPKQPAPKEEDLSKGVLEAVDMDSYRAEARAALKMTMNDADAQVEPLPPGGCWWQRRSRHRQVVEHHQELQ